ncbi:MAG: DUF362 domain-containing protein [Acutalibacteraceae bacterium]|nr:DUF362 domain-containing protein [Acutalibacteraceae bacterium]
MKPKVYFSKDISPDTIVKLYEAVGLSLSGKVAVKVHSGEPGNQNFLRPEFWKPIIYKVNGTAVECNTAYEGGRHNTEAHLKTLEEHGWSPLFNTQILDGEGDDLVLDIKKGEKIKKNYVGRAIADYDGILVLSHFKGHPMGGFGGALKQLSIGFASSYGKKYIHGVGDTDNFWGSDHDSFLISMAEAASTITEMFSGRAVYINVMANMSVDCDCCAVAEDPCMKDIGVLASTDPVAIDKACLDLVYASTDPGRDHLIERIESRNGKLTVEAAAKLGVGSMEYDLVEI